jgi:hypothetical protein
MQNTVPTSFINSPYEPTLHLLGADTREIRKFLSVKNKWNRHLYKYKSCNVSHLRNLIVDSYFYMSSRHQLNDPFDVRSVVDFIDGGIDRVAYLNKLFKQFKTTHKGRKEISKRLFSPAFIEQEIRNHLNKAVNLTGFHSFAASPRNLLMWSHYADSHKGVCLMYETAKDLDTFVKALPVEYSKSFPVIQYTQNIAGDLIRKAFLTKADDWAYEKERRIFEMDRAGQYMFYAPRSLVGVILGAKISNTDEAKVRDLLIEREARGHPSLRLYRAVCQESSYAVKVYQD